MKTKIVYILFFVLLSMSCRSGPQEKQALTDAARAADNQTVQHLITDYSGMKEDTLVSSAWIDANFKLENCSEIGVGPVLNFSSLENPRVQKRILAALRDSIEEKNKNPEGKSVLLTAAITGMHGKPGFLKRFSPSYEDMPLVEIEIIVSEKQSKRELAKFCHMARDKDMDKALEKLLKDVTAFVDKI